MARDFAAYLQAALEAAPAVAPADLRDRFRGAMLGLAAGNALGLPAEGLRRDLIALVFEGGLRDIPPAFAQQPWDDDTAQAVILAEACLATGRLRLDDLATRFVRWRWENGRGIGLLTDEVLGQLAVGRDPSQAARRVWEGRDRNAAGNGSVMRCAPVGLRWSRSPADLPNESRTSSVITHFDERCVWSTTVVCALVALATAGARWSAVEMAEALRAEGAPDEVVESVAGADALSPDAMSLDGEDMGYALRALEVGLWAARASLGLETILLRVVHAGGDTDTNGAVAGAVAGARFGLAALPARWQASLHQPDRLIELADRLLEAAASG